MEHVKALMYHKILDSDFTNMYEVKKPHGGNGQTYIQAAGFSREELDEMFQHASIITDTVEFWDEEKKYPRKKYIIDAQEIGTLNAASIEFAPRTGRRDYRIARQNIKNRHPAWRHDAGFPEPGKIDTINDNGAIVSNYTPEKNYPGIIDNLYIFIVCTCTDNGQYKYYASYVNSTQLPDSWPVDFGLEKIFQGQRSKQGILFFRHQYLRFRNNKVSPFLPGSAVDEDVGEEDLPEDIENTTVDAVVYAKKDVDLSMDINTVAFNKVESPAPYRKRGKRSPGAAGSGNKDYLQRQRNNKTVGDVGESLALELEKRRLNDLGRTDLAKQVVQVSKTVGDGLGYDIESFDLFNGIFEKIYIEVKATTGGINKPFDISINEVEVSNTLAEHYYIYRLFGLRKNPRSISYYVMNGSIECNFNLIPTSYQAFPK